MIKIVFIGNGFHNRIKVLQTIENCTIDVINGVNEESVMNKLPNGVIDLFVIDRTKTLFRRIINLINSNININHIPIISLITKQDLKNETINDGDLFVSEFVTDIEFKYYVKAMIKMKLMDDELKKEKIVLELKVKERTRGLQESESKYKRIYDNVPDLIYTLDLEGNILTVNNNVRYLGYEPEDIIGKNISYVLDQEYIDKSFENINKKIENPSLTTKYIVEINTKDGNKRTVEVKSHFINNETSNNVEIFVMSRDVTDVFTSEKIIREEQERYKNMFDNMRSCVAVFCVENDGEDFIFTGWNKSAAETEQISKEDIIGKKIQDVFPGIYNSKFIEKLKNVYKTGKSINDKPFYYENPNTGVKGWRDNFIYKLKSTDEIIAIYDNITERVEYQEELEKAKNKAENSDKIKSIFISNMSHEIRTPMNSIIGFASLLETETKASNIKNYIDIITSQGNLLLALIDDIMDLSKIESGNMKINKTEFGTKKLFINLKEQFKLELKNRDKSNIKLLTSVKKYQNIYTDYKRINQILNNLILNAIKFTTEGYIKYGFIIKNNFIEFFVEDTGIGIKEENIEKVFERFYQIDRKKVKKQEGTGLGLTICKAIVELLGGDLWIESEFEIGTTVYFTIPIEEPEEQLIEDKKTVVNIDTNICEGKNVLIIEDNDINYELLEILLLSSKMNVTRASNSKEFYNIINDFEFDLVLLDIQLPEIDGWELLDWLTENKKDIPVIVQTAYASIENEIKATNMGAKYFAPKPINASELLHKIKTICNNSLQ